MSPKSQLVSLNGLVQNEQGIYCDVDDVTNFNYSDGEQVEQYLYQVLSQADDLSSNSKWLDEQIVDWPSEYHLSSMRANLLRGFDFSDKKNVLELGCGCGAITRFLAEHSHLQIDAVEGSMSRATLAAMRCKEMTNVAFSVANFNDIEFPNEHYDVILLVGVVEYAGRFSKFEDDEQALRALIEKARKALNQDGVIVIAIENRLGLKYLFGAREDHLAQPLIGLKNYPNSQGIRTYSKSQWLTQINKLRIPASKFVYPFPDYKIPFVLVAEDGVASIDTQRLLKEVQSRDYVAPFCIDNENVLWNAVHDANSFEELANSFLVLLANSDSSIQSFCSFTSKQYESLALPYLNKTSEHRPVCSQEGAALAAEKSTQQHAQVLETELLKKQQELDKLHQRLTNIYESRSWRMLALLHKIKTFFIKR